MPTNGKRAFFDNKCICQFNLVIPYTEYVNTMYVLSSCWISCLWSCEGYEVHFLASNLETQGKIKCPIWFQLICLGIVILCWFYLKSCFVWGIFTSLIKIYLRTRFRQSLSHQSAEGCNCLPDCQGSSFTAKFSRVPFRLYTDLKGLVTFLILRL